MSRLLQAGGQSQIFTHGAPATNPRWLAGGIPAADCIGAYEPMGAASLAASYTNLANPGTFDAAPGTAPAWDAVNGWKGGSNAYLTTGIIPTNAYSAIVRYTNAATSSTNYLFGVTTNGLNMYFGIQPGTTNGVNYVWGNNDNAKAPALTAGVLALTPTAGYRDGALDKTITSTWTGTQTRAMYLLAFNSNGSLGSPTTAYIQRIYIYRISIAAYMADLLAAINS